MVDDPPAHDLPVWPVRGVLSVLVTAFSEDEAIDLDSMQRQVDYQINWGVDGLVLFGLASEVYMLTDAERSHLIEAVVAAADRRVPVIVGCEHNSILAAAQRAEAARELGAAGLMAFPPSFLPGTPADVVDYYAMISKASGLPVVVQDAPAWTGVNLDEELLARLPRHLSTPVAVKVEALPTASKIASLQRLGVPAIGGYGAVHLAEEMDVGIEATMPGSGLPGLICDIWRKYSDADEGWERLYEQALPLLVFQMASIELFIAVQKYLLARCGVLDHSGLRRPGVDLDDRQRDWLNRLLASRILSSYVDTQQTSRV